jgi:two-component system alkaline phosphatase synthesis response regulator PhoP
MEKSHKIMVVEDNLDESEITKMILESRGYTVITANNGGEAKEMIEREKPDFIILDVMMPKMDGLSFCSWLRAIDDYKNIPVVLLTSVSKRIHDSKHSHREIMNVDVDEYLEKPVPPEILLKIIERLLNKYGL